MYGIDDFACTVVGGRLRAGDDATDVTWAGPEDLARLPLAPGVADALTQWSVLPLRGPGADRP